MTKGIIIADTKFEFGKTAKGVVLADEVLTPDSSRFWPADSYAPGKAQLSYDKQYVRDYLEEIHWEKKPPAPALPEAGTAEHQRKVRGSLSSSDRAGTAAELTDERPGLVDRGNPCTLGDSSRGPGLCI